MSLRVSRTARPPFMKESQPTLSSTLIKVFRHRIATKVRRTSTNQPVRSTCISTSQSRPGTNNPIISYPEHTSTTHHRSTNFSFQVHTYTYTCTYNDIPGNQGKKNPGPIPDPGTDRAGRVYGEHVRGCKVCMRTYGMRYICTI